MSPVTPKPAAEFSTLAMTKSSDSRSIRAGIARRAISRPGFPKMSPMNRMRMLTDGNPDLLAAALGEARQDDAQLAVDERGGGGACVERAFDTDGTREPPERAFGHVERGVFVLARRGQLAPRDQQHVAGKHDLDVGRRATRDVDQDFDRLLGFDNVHGGRAVRGGAFGFEEANEVGGQFPALDVDAGHLRILHPSFLAPLKRCATPVVDTAGACTWSSRAPL